MSSIMLARKLTPTIGAEVTNFNITTATSNDIQQLKQLLLESHVLFLPNQPASMSVEDHINFGRNFGVLQGHPNLSKAVNESYPEIFELRASKGGVANEWHTDLTFQKNPAKMSILRMLKCPTVGGDTMWCNLEAAFQALSKPMQDLLEKLTALHDAHPHNKPEVTAIHPVVRVHPQTGRKSLYVNEHFTRRIVELTQPESKTILEWLTKHIADPRFNIRYQWTPNTIAIWDNTCTQHCVLNNFDGEERHIQRVTIAGDVVVGSNKNLPIYKPSLSGIRAGAQSRHDRQLFLHYKRESQANNSKL
jgi:taurine dioxygenase